MWPRRKAPRPLSRGRTMGKVKGEGGKATGSGEVASLDVGKGRLQGDSMS